MKGIAGIFFTKTRQKQQILNKSTVAGLRSHLRRKTSLVSVAFWSRFWAPSWPIMALKTRASTQRKTTKSKQARK